MNIFWKHTFKFIEFFHQFLFLFLKDKQTTIHKMRWYKKFAAKFNVAGMGINT